METYRIVRRDAQGCMIDTVTMRVSALHAVLEMEVRNRENCPEGSRREWHIEDADGLDITERVAEDAGDIDPQMIADAVADRAARSEDAMRTESEREES